MHDTLQCPQNTLAVPSGTGSPPISPLLLRRTPAEPAEERPYCEHCETFGHWTDECDDDTTF